MSKQLKPLSDLIILDMSRVLAGPWATQLLADLGATIIKIENPKNGDDTRAWGPPFFENNDRNMSAYFASTNRGKYSIAVDIKTIEGQKLIIDLAKKSDIFIENFKVGQLKKYNLDYNSIKNIKDDIIYCSISGFGQEGPYKDKPGYDYMIQAMGGLMSITGERDEKGGQPMRVGIPIIDIMCGMYVSNALQAALIYKQNTKKGQYIDISLLDVSAAMLANQAMNFLATNNPPQRIGNTHPTIVPYQKFTCKDCSIIVAVGNDKQFQILCEILNLEYLKKDPNYITNAERVINRDKLENIINQELAKYNSSEIITKLENKNIPCGKINDIKELFDNEQIKFRQMKRSLHNKDIGDIPSVRSPIFSDQYEVFTNIAPPLHNQDKEFILKEILGYSIEDI